MTRISTPSLLSQSPPTIVSHSVLERCGVGAGAGGAGRSIFGGGGGGEGGVATSVIGAGLTGGSHGRGGAGGGGGVAGRGGTAVSACLASGRVADATEALEYAATALIRASISSSRPRTHANAMRNATIRHTTSIVSIRRNPFVIGEARQPRQTQARKGSGRSLTVAVL